MQIDCLHRVLLAMRATVTYQRRANDAGVTTDDFQKQDYESHRRMADRVSHIWARIVGCLAGAAVLVFIIPDTGGVSHDECKSGSGDSILSRSTPRDVARYV